MSTRSTTHFCHDDGSTVAIVYRHSDGYPGVAGADLFRFLNEVNDNVKDKRFSDPTYLAAKYVVWLAHEFNNEYDTDKGWTPCASRLEFLSVGILSTDPLDIEYQYRVICDGLGSLIPVRMTAKRKAKAVVDALSTSQKPSGVPTVKCFEVGCKDCNAEPGDWVLDYKELDLAAEIAKYNRETAARRKSA